MDDHNSQNSGWNSSSSHSGYSDPYGSSNNDYMLSSESGGQPPVPLKHSGPGIASFIVGLVGLIGHIITFVLVSLALYSSLELLDSSIGREELAFHPAIVLASLAFLACLILNLAGIILGVIGLVLKNRRKVFAIIGTVLNGLLILLFAVLVVAGIYMT
ncbi:hypothetical protein HUB98_25695 [Paenibacillus barcinonensis]|uniref:Uncharacterized protein n=1 Tax=Paenibacillus barcinonensis TaxID=198119 RepID=A0A2V4VFH2_PAEBA|nr:hypothetical protein [Paenibacillus barcinonensis]PYE52590.1 hypothetical protein DFQ00_101528 [Paenibacillus barcinonensis]QKS59261.1 hypothetical protein HUB98_25695 [Paenibacillus barcinonensis]